MLKKKCFLCEGIRLNSYCSPLSGSSGVPYLKKRLTHKLGWMALLPSGQTYNWYFKDVDQITNITYSAGFYSFKVPHRPNTHTVHYC
jgi:hypothetical protein